MHPEVAVNVAYGRKLAGMEDEDREKLRKELYEELVRNSGPWDAAGANLIEKISHPADTRKETITALRRNRGPSGREGMSQRLLAVGQESFE